jgi:hypothetical protein
VKKEQASEGGRRAPARRDAQAGGISFVNVIGSMELSPVLLRELRKAMATLKKKKAISATTPKASASALAHLGGTGGGVRTSLDSVQPNVCKTKA